MKALLKTVLVGFLLLGCQQVKKEKLEQKVVFNQDLANELNKMVKVDQIAAYIPQGKYEQMTKEQWNAFKDSVFTTHQKRLEQLFDQYGFMGFDLVGEKGSQNFWLMVQHSDHNPDFQKEVLRKMKIAMDNKNAKPSNYGLLVDRVRINTGKKQVFGTQVTYNTEIGQAYPKELEDSINVNQRRKSIGLESIEEYLNNMTKMHFEMNKAYYEEKGITEPKLYTTKTND
ncbi:DUF6624 domain-containing protein [uncultured Croceitalea sp.]|uniref:DUF6624 domain-containing protein n=1 Tax=uncultured Croceitalea sp. TaxID=1798908 RepID=UPI003305F48A